MRRGPEAVPGHQILVPLLIIGKIVLVLAISTVIEQQTTALSLITQIVTWATVVGVLTAIALHLRGHLSRFTPTFSAILGSDLMMVFVYGSLFVIVHLLNIDIDRDLGNLMNVLFQLWTIFIVGFIMHRALNLNIGLGIFVGLVIMMFSLSISYEVANLT